MNWKKRLLAQGTVATSFEKAEKVFSDLADFLLNKVEIEIGQKAHRLGEIEFYLYSDNHPDLFTHCDPLQKTWGIWYFHRMNDTFKGGSFKGFDLTFGPPQAHGGILIRSLEKPDGELIEGPSLCVDYLLESTGFEEVAHLHRALSQRPAWEEESLIQLVHNPHLQEREIFSSARRGLTLKDEEEARERIPFILRPYRYFVTPSRIKKGRVYIILALYQKGKSPEEIREITGSPLRSIQRHIENFQAGKEKEDFSEYLGVSFKSSDLARLHGTWQSKFGSNKKH